MKILKDYGFIGDQESGDSDRGTLVDFKPDVTDVRTPKNTDWRTDKTTNIKLESFEDVVIQYSAAHLKWKKENKDLKSKIENLSHVEKELQKTRNEFKELKGAFLASQRQRKATECQYRELRDKLEASSRQYKDVQTKYQESQSKTVDLENSILKLKNSIVKVENEKLSIQKNYKELMERFFVNQTELMALNKAFDANRDQIIQLESQYAKEQAQPERDTNLVQSNIKLNQRLSNGLQGLKSDLVGTESRYRQITESKKILENENIELRKRIDALDGLPRQLSLLKEAHQKETRELRQYLVGWKARYQELEQKFLEKTQKNTKRNTQSLLKLQRLEMSNHRQSEIVNGQAREIFKLRKALGESERKASKFFTKYNEKKSRLSFIEKALQQKSTENSDNILRIQTLEDALQKQKELVKLKDKAISNFEITLQNVSQQSADIQQKHAVSQSRIEALESAFEQKSIENRRNADKVEDLESLNLKLRATIEVKDKALVGFENAEGRVQATKLEIQNLQTALDLKSDKLELKNQDLQAAVTANTRLKEVLGRAVKIGKAKNEKLRRQAEKITTLENFKADSEAQKKENLKAAENLQVAQEKFVTELRAFGALRQEFELASQALKNQQKLLDSESKNLELKKRDVDRKLSELSGESLKGRADLRAGLPPLPPLPYESGK